VERHAGLQAETVGAFDQSLITSHSPFAASADVAKGGDGAKSALREISVGLASEAALQGSDRYSMQN